MDRYQDGDDLSLETWNEMNQARLTYEYSSARLSTTEWTDESTIQPTNGRTRTWQKGSVKRDESDRGRVWRVTSFPSLEMSLDVSILMHVACKSEGQATTEPVGEAVVIV